MIIHARRKSCQSCVASRQMLAGYDPIEGTYDSRSQLSQTAWTHVGRLSVCCSSCMRGRVASSRCCCLSMRQMYGRGCTLSRGWPWWGAAWLTHNAWSSFAHEADALRSALGAPRCVGIGQLALAAAAPSAGRRSLLSSLLSSLSLRRQRTAGLSLGLPDPTRAASSCALWSAARPFLL